MSTRVGVVCHGPTVQLSPSPRLWGMGLRPMAKRMRTMFFPSPPWDEWDEEAGFG